jgi:uncharacterized RDD family membrane protein YckC
VETEVINPELPNISEDMREPNFAGRINSTGFDLDNPNSPVIPSVRPVPSAIAVDKPEFRRFIPDAEPASATPHQPNSTDGPSQPLVADAQIFPDPSAPTVPEPDSNPSPWREELASRLGSYRARRKPRPPRYPSLRLRFESDEPVRSSDPGTPSSFYASRQSVALDGTMRELAAGLQTSEPAVSADLQEIAGPPFAQSSPPPLAQTNAQTNAKIIEFPRSSGAPPVRLDELAEPFFDRPRILEVPEIAPPPPALGGITIEAAERKESVKRPGIDVPLQSAPVARRVLAAATDGLIVAAASAFFAFIFWKVAGVRPPNLEILGMTAVGFCVLWFAYQFLLITYSASTPGLCLARLDLAHFDGSPTNRRRRRWRVVASFLSAASLGMGYAWIILDEDALCWHDRITQTYLAPRMDSSDPASRESAHDA